MQSIHINTVILDSEIGNSIIGPFCVIGGPGENKDHHIKPSGRVKIGDGNILYKLVTVDEMARIGDDCTIMAHSHIGHHARIMNNVIIATGAVVGGHCVVESKVYLGLNSTLHPRTHVKTGALLGAGSFAKGTLEAYWIYAGVPAKPIKPNWEKMKEDRLDDEQEKEVINNPIILEQKLGWKKYPVI